MPLSYPPDRQRAQPPRPKAKRAPRPRRAAAAPSQIARNGDHDPKTGHFVPGWRGGPGRPKGIDFRALITEQRGASLADDLVRLFDRLLVLAISGDVQAAKLLLDRVCQKDAVQIEAGESFDALLRRALGIEVEVYEQ